MNDNINENVNQTEEQYRAVNPTNTARLEFLAKKSDRVFVYASKVDDGIDDDGVV